MAQPGMQKLHCNARPSLDALRAEPWEI